MSNWRKWRLLHKLPQLAENTDANSVSRGIITVSGVGDYFEPLLDDVDVIREYFAANMEPGAIAEVPLERSDDVAIHVRFGDYNVCPAGEKILPRQYVRTDISWYVDMVKVLTERMSGHVCFKLFSDGSDKELAPLLCNPAVRRCFYGNALADIIGISRCRALIGSDSTFSGWGAFLGGIPAVFFHCHFSDDARVPDNWCVVASAADLPEAFLQTKNGGI